MPAARASSLEARQQDWPGWVKGLVLQSVADTFALLTHSVADPGGNLDGTGISPMAGIRTQLVD